MRGPEAAVTASSAASSSVMVPPVRRLPPGKRRRPPPKPLQPQQRPEALEAGFQSIAGGVLPPADPQHAAHIAEAQAHGQQRRDKRQKIRQSGEHIPAVHAGKTAGMGDLLVQCKLEQQDQKPQPQGNGGVKKDDVLLIFGILQLFTGRFFEIAAG